MARSAIRPLGKTSVAGPDFRIEGMARSVIRPLGKTSVAGPDFRIEEMARSLIRPLRKNQRSWTKKTYSFSSWTRKGKQLFISKISGVLAWAKIGKSGFLPYQ